MSLNSTTFVGRAGRDAEIRFLDNGKQVANFTIAVNRRKRDADPIWIKVEVWGKPAQVAADYVRKGIMVGVSGEVDLDSWTDRQSGEKRQQLKITANDLRLLSSKQDGNAPATGSAASAAPSPGDDEPLF